MTRSALLAADALINVVLGVLLIVFPSGLVQLLGVPLAEPGFYRSILGAVLVGIGIALWLEKDHRGGAVRGLGLTGAVVINLCGGIALAGWLLTGGLSIPTRGLVTLWVLVLVLVGISLAELLARRDRP